jgi:ferritin-like metal-binding protein YciE
MGVRIQHQEDFMAATERTLSDLFLDGIKDIYFAEKQILKALPKMAKAAKSDELRSAFQKHIDETEGQVERLTAIFGLLEKVPRGKTCDAILGMIAEGEHVIEDYANSAAIDAGLLAAAQAVEHYEISRYGTLKVWAQTLDLSQAAKLLDATLKEEKKTDEILSTIAEAAVNQKAAA